MKFTTDFSAMVFILIIQREKIMKVYYNNIHKSWIICKKLFYMT